MRRLQPKFLRNALREAAAKLPSRGVSCAASHPLYVDMCALACERPGVHFTIKKLRYVLGIINGISIGHEHPQWETPRLHFIGTGSFGSFNQGCCPLDDSLRHACEQGPHFVGSPVAVLWGCCVLLLVCVCVCVCMWVFVCLFVFGCD